MAQGDSMKTMMEMLKQIQEDLTRSNAKLDRYSAKLEAASDGGLSIDAADAAVLPEVSSSTTKAQEVLEVIHDASPDYITMAPVTCSTDCSNQVVATDIVNEVHDVNEVRDATTAIFPEPAIDPNGKAVKQPTPAISADVDPSDLATSPLTMCSTKCSHSDANPLMSVLSPAATPSWLMLRPEPWPSFWRDHAEGTKVRPIPWPSFSMGRFLEHPYMSVQLHGIGMNSSSIPKKIFHTGNSVYNTWEQWHNLGGHCILLQNYWATDTATELLNLYVVAWSGTKILHIYSKKQPWPPPLPPPLRAGIKHLRHMFRPRLWPWFDYHLDADYPKEPCSCISNQPHDVSWFSFGLVLLLFRDKDFIPVYCCQLIPVEEPFICLPGTQLPSRRPPVLAPSDATQFSQEEAIHREQVKYRGLQFSPCCLVQSLEGGEHFSHCETAYGFYLEMLALVSKMWKSNHCWVSLLCLVQSHYLFLGDLCGTPSYTFHVSIKCWFEQQNERTCSLLVAVELPLQPMHMRMIQTMKIFRELISTVTIENYSSSSSVVYPGNVHERRVQYNTVKCKEFKLFGIHLVGSFTCLQVVHVWQYLPDGPRLPLWPPNSQENSGKTVRKKISCSGTLTTISMQLVQDTNCWENRAMLREPWNTYHSSFYWEPLVGLIQWHNILLGNMLRTPGLLKCYTAQPNARSHNWIAATALAFCIVHKKVLQIVEEFWEPIPKLTVENIGSNNSVAEIKYNTAVWGREGCKFVIWMPHNNDKVYLANWKKLTNSTVIHPMSSCFDGFASSHSRIHPVHEFSCRMSRATDVKMVTNFEALFLGKLPQTSCLPLSQPKYPWALLVSAFLTHLLLFHMKTIDEYVNRRKTYSRLFQLRADPLFASKSASGYYLEQSWDPGGSTLSIWIPPEPSVSLLLKGTSRAVPYLDNPYHNFGEGGHVSSTCKLLCYWEKLIFKLFLPLPYCCTTLQSNRDALKLQSAGVLCPRTPATKPHGSNCTELLGTELCSQKDPMLQRYTLFSIWGSLEVGLLSGIILQDWFLSCFRGHIIECGFELIHWKIAWSLNWQHSDGGNQVAQHFSANSVQASLLAHCSRSYPTENCGRHDLNSSKANAGTFTLLTYVAMKSSCGMNFSHGKFSQSYGQAPFQTHVNHAYYIHPVQVNCDHRYISHDYHHSPGMFRKSHVTWDPGVRFPEAAAWGQAAFQGGRNVTPRMQRRWAKRRAHALAKRAAAEHQQAGAEQQQAGAEPDETEAATSSSV